MRTGRLRTGCLAALVVLTSTSACVSSEADSSGGLQIAIDSGATVLLGESDGPAALGAVIRVDVDGQGRFWVFSEQYMPLVFAADGSFLASVGRPGQGPGEMSSPYRLWTLPGDSIAILDSPSLHVYSESLAFVRTVRLPMIDPRDALILAWPETVLVNVTRPSPPAFGQPLHLVDLSGPSGIYRSFGTTDTQSTRMDADRKLQRSLAWARTGGYWSADRDRYQIERWSREHVREHTMQFEPEWFEGPSNLDSGNPDRAPSPVNLGVREDSAGRLWGYFLVGSPDFAGAWDRVRDQFAASGFQEIRSTDVDWSKLYDTRIEVIDPVRGEVLASQKTRGMAVSHLPHQRVAIRTEAADGTPRVKILSLTLTGASDR